MSMLVLLLLMLMPAWAHAFTTDQQEDVCAQSWVIFCENFEDRALGTADLTRAKFKNGGWGVSQPSGMGVVADGNSVDGTKAFRFDYPSVSVPWPNVDAGSTGFIDATYSPASEYYYRWWSKLSADFVRSPVSTKHGEIDGGFVGHVWQFIFGAADPVFTTQLSNTNVNWPQNSGTFNWNTGDTAWHCFEARVIVNSTLNGTDGLLQGWVDSVQRLSYANINVSNQRTSQSSFLLGGYWNCLDNGSGCTTDSANNHPAMERWHDNIVVGTQRIGCGTPPSSDTTPPTQVTGTVATPGNGVITLSNMSASDNVGVGVINIYRATSSTGPFSFVAAVGAGGGQTVTNVSYPDTGLTNGVTYYYQQQAQDTSGNLGPFGAVVSATPQAPTGGAATVLGISQGKFTINGIPAFLQCFSYYDFSNYHTADLDALAADGYNCLAVHVDDVLRNNGNSAYNSDGTIKAAKETAMIAARNYADSKGMVLLVNCIYADVAGTNSAAYLTTEAARTTATTECVTKLQYGNVMFALVNEHNYDLFADAHAKMQAFMTTARAACPTCLMSFSSTDYFGTYPAGGHLFTTQDGSVVNTTNVQEELATGINFLLWHDERNGGFQNLATARVSNMLAYLASIGRTDIPVFGDEPAREGSGGLGSAAAYFSYYQAMKNAGIAGIDQHTAAAFDLDPTQAIPNQTDVVEEAVMDGLAAALASGTGQVRDTASVTDDFNRANNVNLGASWDPETIGSHTNLQIVSNRIRPTSTTLESRETHTGTLPNNQWACIELPTFTAGSSYTWAMVMLRWTGPGTGNGYDLRAYRNNHLGYTTEIVRKDANNPASLVQNTTTWAAGDELCGEANGSTLTLYKNDVAVATATDSTYSSGRAGVYLWSDAAVADVEGDNFSAGGFTTAPVIVTPIITGINLTSTGLTYTHTGSLASVRLLTGAGSTLYTLAQTPGGVITHPWTAADGNSACLFARDANGVENQVGTDYKCGDPSPFVPPSDTTPPTASNVAPVGEVLAAGTTSTVISLTSNENALARWDTSCVAYASMANAFPVGQTGLLTHSATITGLVDNTAYTRYSRLRDSAGNDQTGCNAHTFSVENAPPTDTTAPSTVVNLAATLITNTQITWNWDVATDASGINHYNFYNCVDGLTCATRVLIGTPSTNSFPDQPLVPGTTYVRTVRAVDNFGNESAANSNVVSATTLPITTGDVIRPSDLTGLSASATLYSSVTLIYDQGTDQGSGLAHVLMERCRGVGCTDFAPLGSSALLFFQDATVRPRETYRYRGKWEDNAENVSLNYSSIVTVTTPDVPAGVVQGMCPCRRYNR